MCQYIKCNFFYFFCKKLFNKRPDKNPNKAYYAQHFNSCSEQKSYKRANCGF